MQPKMLSEWQKEKRGDETNQMSTRDWIVVWHASVSRVVSPSLRLQVMKCVVEALADVLSRPRPLPVSQDCLATLRSGRSRPAFQPRFLHSLDHCESLNAKLVHKELSIQRSVLADLRR